MPGQEPPRRRLRTPLLLMTGMAVLWVGWEAIAEIERAYLLACGHGWSQGDCLDVDGSVGWLKWIVVLSAICVPCAIHGALEWWCQARRADPPSS